MKGIKHECQLIMGEVLGSVGIKHTHADINNLPHHLSMETLSWLMVLNSYFKRNKANYILKYMVRWRKL